jgi:glucosamine--fructose-6-phosphate aminotransferase (isomerizing)
VDHLYAIGRGVNYPTALEAALKIKEVSYIHAEGFAGGELKHGVIALVEEGTPCLVFVANDRTRDSVLSNAKEIKSRGAFIIGVAPEDNEVFDVWIKVPDVGLASPIVNVIPAQLLAYYLAVERGLDPDKPRNLAKSVTVK